MPFIPESSPQPTDEKRRRFPWATAAIAAIIVAVAAKSNSKEVADWTMVYPDSSWVEWAARSIPSFFVPPPEFGEPADGVAAVLLTSPLVAIERRDGAPRMLTEALALQAGACIATRTMEVSNMLPPDMIHEPDVGFSGVAVRLATKYLVEKAREAETRRRQIALYAGTAAFGASTALGAWAAGDLPSAVAHVTGFAGGLFAGFKQELGETSFESTAA